MTNGLSAWRKVCKRRKIFKFHETDMIFNLIKLSASFLHVTGTTRKEVRTLP